MAKKASKKTEHKTEHKVEHKTEHKIEHVPAEAPKHEGAVLAENTTQEHKVEEPTNKNKLYALGAIIVIVILAALLLNMDKIFPAIGETPSGVVAEVNGEKITIDQLNKEYLMGVPAEYRSYVKKEDFLNQSMIPEAILLQEARRLGIKADDKDMEKMIDDAVVEGGMTQEEFDAMLTKEGLIKKDLIDSYNRRIVIAMLLNETIFKEIEVIDSEIATYYNDNIDTMVKDEQIKASHILVATEEEANTILDELKGGADFAELATQKSICPSNKSGGDLGFFSKGQMVPEFEQAAFAMDIGQLSDVVKTQFGYHIITVTDKKEGGNVSLGDASASIKAALLSAKQKSAAETYVDQLTKKADIKIYSISSALNTVTAPETTTSAENLDAFAKCLTEKGAVMFGRYNCPHCVNQKGKFGDSFQYVTYVECGKGGEDAKKCEAEQLSGVPAWKIDGEITMGDQPLSKLAQLSGCSLE